jgi:SSS family solute:Na+ symporter
LNPDLRATVPIQLAALVAYSGGLMAFGLWMSRRVRETGSFFVADRSLGPGLVFATFLAANIGAGSIIGASGLAYSVGVSAWWFVGSAGIGQLAFALWIGPRIWRIAKEHGLYTAGDYLELRYGSAVRAVIASVLWLGTLTILSAQLIAMSEILEWVLGVPRWVGAVVGGVVMTVYFGTGGLLTAAWVNLVQLVVLLGGFAIGVPMAVAIAGGWQAVLAAAPDTPGYMSLWTTGGLVFFVLIMPAFVVSPGLLQKGFGAVDERALRLGVGAQAIVLLAFAAAPVVMGLVAHVYAPALANPEFAVPTVLTLGLPVLLGALGLAAVFSAEMSSADAVLFMLSTSLSKDIYKRYVATDASDARVLRVARLAAVGGGGAGVLLTILIPTVIDAITIFYSVLSVSLFVPVVAGLYSRRPGVPEALAAIGAGIAGLFAVRMSELTTVSRWLDPTALGIAASAMAFLLVFLARRTSAAPPHPTSPESGRVK